MKKTLLIASSLLVFGVLLLKDFKAVGDPNGNKFGYTGGPRDNKTCGSNGGCHTGSPITNLDGLIVSDIPPAGYTPGQTYTISATVTEAGLSKFGFNITTEDASGTAVGTFIANTGTQAKGNGKYATNLSTSNTGSGTKTWNATWVAPSTGTGSVTFYAAFNAANGNNADTGDKIYTSSLAVNELSFNNSVADFKGEALTAKLYPNPVSTHATLEYSLAEGRYSFNVIDITGKVIQNFSQKVYSHGGIQEFSFDASNLVNGIYFIEIQNENKSHYLKFQKN